MFKKVSVSLFYCAVLVITSQSLGAASIPPEMSVRIAQNAVTGELKKFDAATKTAVVKLADGTEEVFKLTEKTTVHGVKSGAKMAALAGKEGGQFIVHYTVVGAEKTADSFKYVGDEAPRVVKGTVAGVDKAGHTIAVKTADGAVDTYHLSEKCVLDTGKGVAEGSDAVGKTVKDGADVTVHYTTEGGKKVAHLVKQVF
jgi:Cu/Ag efflux protein CusF